MPDAKSGVSDHEFLYLTVKYSPQIQPDFEKIGAAIGITKYSAYCRFNSIKKKFEAEAAAADGAVTNASAPTTAPKRKRAAPKKKQNSANTSKDDEVEAEEEKAKKRPKAHGEQDNKVKVEVEHDFLNEDDVF